MAPQAAEPVEVFISYSHQDDELRAQLETHLAMLRRKGVVRGWSDRRINPGQEWDKQIDEHLESAEVILLLVSPDFLASDYCYDIELTRAMERHEAGEARVVPVILRFCDDWQSAPFGKLQALPKDAQPVTDWPNRDKAFADVAAGIRRAVEELLSSREEQSDTPGEKHSPPSPIPRPPVIGFVSRRDAQGRDIIERLREELAPGRDQLVTLSGPGGIGKSTLAAQAARGLYETYGRRVVWSSADGRADFSLLSLLDDVATQLGRADLRTLAPAEKEGQVRALAAGALVVLDNYETVAEEEQKRIEAWFKQTPCSALFTSRPRVPDTVFVPVLAMSREEAAEFLNKLAGQTQDPQLFTPEVRERVYETAEANPYVMQWVVGQIDLAQEPGAVLEELRHGEGDAAERIFDRSFELPLLEDDGRDALIALSLFAPSATPDALAAVAGFDDVSRVREAVKNLRRLWLVKGADGNRRLVAEGLTRTLAGSRLSRDPRAGLFRRRFVTYFHGYAEKYVKPTAENYDALEGEKDNLLGAAEGAFDSEDWWRVVRIALIVANPADSVLFVRGYWDETMRLNEKALQAAHIAKDVSLVAALSHNLAVMYGERGELNKVRPLYEESLKISKERNDQVMIAMTLHQLGRLEHQQGNLEEARRLYEESFKINERIGGGETAIYFGQLGNLAFDLKDFAEARRLYNKCLEITEAHGDYGNASKALNQLALLAQEQGEIEEASRLYHKSLEIKRRLGDKDGIARSLHQLGKLAEAIGNKKDAAKLFREALNILEKLGSPDAKIARESLARVEGEVS